MANSLQGAQALAARLQEDSDKENKNDKKEKKPRKVVEVPTSKSVSQRNATLHKRAREFFTHDRTSTVVCLTITRGKNVVKTTMLGAVPAAATLQSVQRATTRIIEILNDVGMDIEDNVNPCEQKIMEVKFQGVSTKSSESKKRKRSEKNREEEADSDSDQEETAKSASAPPSPPTSEHHTADGLGDEAAADEAAADEAAVDETPTLALCRLMQEAQDFLQGTIKDAGTAEVLWEKLDNAASENKEELEPDLLKEANRILHVLSGIWYRD